MLASVRFLEIIVLTERNSARDRRRYPLSTRDNVEITSPAVADVHPGSGIGVASGSAFEKP